MAGIKAISSRERGEGRRLKMFTQTIYLLNNLSMDLKRAVRTYQQINYSDAAAWARYQKDMISVITRATQLRNAAHKEGLPSAEKLAERLLPVLSQWIRIISRWSQAVLHPGEERTTAQIIGKFKHYSKLAHIMQRQLKAKATSGKSHKSRYLLR